jgi:serine protease Do
MPFPIEPDARFSEPESDFTIQDPFGLRLAITPVFAFDLQDGMLRNPRHGVSIGLGTSFYVTPFGRQLSAMHVTTDFFNAQKVSICTGPERNIIQPNGTCIGIYQDPGLVYGTRKAGEILFANDFVMFPVDQTKDPLAFNFSADRLKQVEPSLDLSAWNVCGLRDRKTVYLPIRVGSPPSIAEGDRVLAVGYPGIESWRRPGAQVISYREQMRGSIGRVIKLDRTWNQDRKVWPTITVDVNWKSGMSGGPVFNENGEVVGIVSRGVNLADESQAWSNALWLEALPFRQDIYGSVDPNNPGWIVGWGVCNMKSLIELFQTRDAAEAFAQKVGPGLSVKHVSTPHTTRFSRAS